MSEIRNMTEKQIKSHLRFGRKLSQLSFMIKMTTVQQNSIIIKGYQQSYLSYLIVMTKLSQKSKLISIIKLSCQLKLLFQSDLRYMSTSKQKTMCDILQQMIILITNDNYESK